MPRPRVGVALRSRDRKSLGALVPYATSTFEKDLTLLSVVSGLGIQKT